MNTYTYFWAREEGGGVISPFFDREEDAKHWAEDRLDTHEKQQEWVKKHRNDPWDEWKATKDIV
jgi:hypothetical protein